LFIAGLAYFGDQFASNRLRWLFVVPLLSSI